MNTAMITSKTLMFTNLTQRYISTLKLNDGQFLSSLLTRRWVLLNPESQINKVLVSEFKGREKGLMAFPFSFTNNACPSFLDDEDKKGKDERFFYIVRDDLLHPLVNGNKARKLDALFPILEDHLVTDVVTCGGCQSAHAAAVAVSCAERGICSHILLRGERPEIPTGYNLVSELYGRVTYIARSLYARREEMLARHAASVAGRTGSVLELNDIVGTLYDACRSESLPMGACRSPFKQETENDRKKVVIINEGAGDAIALLGVIRLVNYLSQNHIFGKEQPVKMVVDAGTGTTAVGLALGALCLRLPWEITAVMLADDIEGYKQQEERLVCDFKRLFALEYFEDALKGVDGGLVNWVERFSSRKFGNVLKGEVEVCQQIARQTGILVDPVYTLAAWEHAVVLCQSEVERDAKVAMLHTGGTLGMFGLAQRYKSFFDFSQQ